MSVTFKMSTHCSKSIVGACRQAPSIHPATPKPNFPSAAGQKPARGDSEV